MGLNIYIYRTFLRSSDNEQSRGSRDKVVPVSNIVNSLLVFCWFKREKRKTRKEKEKGWCSGFQPCHTLQCDRRFRTGASKAQHVRDCHPRLFACTECNRKPFRSESALARHVRDSHRVPVQVSVPALPKRIPRKKFLVPRALVKAGTYDGIGNPRRFAAMDTRKRWVDTYTTPEHAPSLGASRHREDDRASSHDCDARYQEGGD